MSKNQAVFVVMLSANLIIPHCTVLAASNCITEPKPSSSGHWYYHADPVTQRKCWFLSELQVRPSTRPIQLSPASKRDASIAGRADTTSKEQENRPTPVASRVADCEIQALKVFNEEKPTFMKQCLSSDTR